MPIRAPRRAIAALTNVPFDEAIDFAKQRDVTLPADYYGELQGAARAQAFTVSHIASLRQIQYVLDVLAETLRDGGTFDDFTTLVEHEGIDLSTPHRETVFRTAVQTSYNAGRRTQQLANKEGRGFLMYDAINDSRTRPAHRAMDGFIAPVDHPVWQRWYPPCGYNCRCSAISLTEAQAKIRGYTGRVREPEVQPDDGWNYDPANRGTAQQKLDKSAAAVASKLPPKVQRAAGKWVIRAARDRQGGRASP